MKNIKNIPSVALPYFPLERPERLCNSRDFFVMWKKSQFVPTCVNSLKGEVWLPVVGYEEIYEISNFGRLKGLYREQKFSCGITHRKKESLKQPRLQRSGYLRVGLFKNSMVSYWAVHRIVAFAFIPNPHNKPQVNHINGIRNDNRAENLEWVTNRENIDHSIRVLGRKPGRKKTEVVSLRTW